MKILNYSHFVAFLFLSSLQLNAAQKADLLKPSKLNLAEVSYLKNKTFHLGGEEYKFICISKSHKLHPDVTLMYRLQPSKESQLVGGWATLILHITPNGSLFIQATTQPLFTDNQQADPILMGYLYEDALNILLHDDKVDPIIRTLERSLDFMLAKLIMHREKLQLYADIRCARCPRPIMEVTTKGETIWRAHVYLGACKHVLHTGCFEALKRTSDKVTGYTCPLCEIETLKGEENIMRFKDLTDSEQ
jgi:hypothetical protein